MNQLEDRNSRDSKESKPNRQQKGWKSRKIARALWGPFWKWSVHLEKKDEERRKTQTGMYYIIFPQPDTRGLMDDSPCC